MSSVEHGSDMNVVALIANRLQAFAVAEFTDMHVWLVSLAADSHPNCLP